MYFVYDYKNALFQFSYCNWDETCEARGIYGIEYQSYYFSKGFFYFSINIKLKNHINIPDVRFNISNKILNDTINIFFIVLNYFVSFYEFLKRKYLSVFEKKFKVMRYSFFVISFFVFIYDFFVVDFFEDSFTVNKKLTVSLDDWKSIIHQMPLAKKIEENKNSYFEDKIPFIKGIYDFQVISLGNDTKNRNEIDRLLAVNFKKIIVIKNDNSILFLHPYKTCLGKNSVNYSIFNINGSDRILIFKDEFSYSKTLRKNFIIVPKIRILEITNKSSSKNICDYMIIS